MTHQSIARFLLAAFCLLQAGATLFIDLGRTHASHPAWTGHARFHVVWQSLTTALLAIAAILLLFVHAPLASQRFFFALILAAMPMCAFFVALISRRYFGATLADENGMPPLMVAIAGKNRRIDLNLAAEIAGVLALAAIVFIYL